MFKILATTAALATIIPISVYASDIVSPTPTPSSAIHSKDGNHAKQHGKGGHFQKQISAELLAKLKLDKQALKEKLAAGKTLAQIADEQGLSRDELKSLLTADFNKALEKRKANFSANLDGMIDGKGFKGNNGFKDKQERKQNSKAPKVSSGSQPMLQTS